MIVRSRSDLTRAVENADPGTRILIAPGTYEGGLHFTGLQGAPGRPIVLAAENPNRPPVFLGRNSCFHLTDPAHVELHHLVLAEASGNGLNIDNGGSYDSPAHHVVLRGLRVRDIGPQGNRDAIKLSGFDDFQVIDCTIEQTTRSTATTESQMIARGRGAFLSIRGRERVEDGS